MINRRDQPKGNQVAALTVLSNDRNWDLELIADQKIKVPDGEYEAVFIRHETITIFQRSKVILWFRITTPGEHFGKEIYRAYNVRQFMCKAGKHRKIRVGVRSSLMKDLVRLFGIVERPDRISLKSFKHCVWCIRTRTVLRDYEQQILDEWLQYSVIDHIVGALTHNT